MDDRELGRRIAYWRRRRGLSQTILADRISKSLSWLRKVETGVRSADRLSVLDTICQALQIDLHVLIGEEPSRGTTICLDEREVERIRSALEQYQLSPPDGAPPDLSALRRRIEHAWTAFEFADYDVISRVLPGVIEDAQAAHLAVGNDASGQMLVEVYEVTASTLRKLGEHSLAWMAGDRGIGVAQHLGDLAAVAATGFRIANALLSMGRAATAQSMCMQLADRLETELATEDRRALYGHILLQGAMAAAAKGDHAAVRDLAAEAARVSGFVTEGSKHHRLEFGPANVHLHRVAALVALGEGGLAVEAAQQIDQQEISKLRRERRAALLVDVARGYSQWGKRDEALSALLDAEALASNEVRCRPMAQATIADLLRRARGAPPAPLTLLARRAGVEV